MNPRLTPKDRGLIKGAMRRAFSRSELRKKVMAKSIVPGHQDPSRPRVTKWSRCAVCSGIKPAYLAVVDHISPVIPTNSSFEAMSLDETVDRMWCDEANLQAICEPCHDEKSTREKNERKLLKPKKPKKPRKAKNT